MTGKPGLLNQVVLKSLSPQILHQHGTVLPRISQAEPLHGLVGELPFLQISVARLSVGCAQLVIEKLRRFLIDSQQPASPALPSASFLRLIRLRQLHPRPLRQHFHRLREGVVLIVHHESVDIPSRAAAEAMVHLKVAVDGKRR